jgi:hypothetical protein
MKVKWDFDVPKIWKKNIYIMFQTTNQIIIYKSPTISNITMEDHHFQWVNPRTKWRFLAGKTNSKNGRCSNAGFDHRRLIPSPFRNSTPYLVAHPT